MAKFTADSGSLSVNGRLIPPELGPARLAYDKNMTEAEATFAEFESWLCERGLDHSRPLFLRAVRAAAIPSRAIATIRNWSLTNSQAGGRLESLAENPAFVYRFAAVAGASQALAESFIQNPELALILADSGELVTPVNADFLESEGKVLIAHATSATHALDRIRLLKQRTMIKIVWNDLSGSAPPEVVWESLSELADATLRLVSQVLWTELSDAPNPVAVIALGKHGSREVNYSSDIDIMFVLDDGWPEDDLPAKFCERFIRAISGKMGRGSLYRVDCRLRPMGSGGPIIQRCDPVLSYYRGVAEAWEIMAMIRARACAGNVEVGETFLSQIRNLVYAGPRSEAFLEGLLHAKRRYEAEVESRGETETNLKLGRGGIRDIEFLTQTLQLVAGQEYVELQGAATAVAIESLTTRGLLQPTEERTLLSAYRFYRQLEHRIQLLFDLQDHCIPSSREQRAALAKLMGFRSESDLLSQIRHFQFSVRSLLELKVPGLARVVDSTVHLPEEFADLTEFDEARVRRLIELSPDSVSLLHELQISADARERIRLIAQKAPHIIPAIAFHEELWDIAFSEEVEMTEADETPSAHWVVDEVSVPNEDWHQGVARSLRRGRVWAALKHAHHGDSRRTSRYLAGLVESALLKALDECGGTDVDVIGVGRLGGGELLLASDWDILMLHPDSFPGPRAERVAEEFLRVGRTIAMACQWFPLDTRLRPEGKSGRLAKSYAAFDSYAADSLEAWERLALTRARSLRGDGESARCLRRAVYGREWTADHESQMAEMRRRIQTERVRSGQQHRDIKIGPGGLLDIEWIASILKLRMGMDAPETPGTLGSLDKLMEMDALNPYECERLKAEFCLYSDIRNSMYLLELDSDSVMPENPDKLDQLARTLSLKGANDVLRAVQDAQAVVGGIIRAVLDWEC